MSISIFHLPTYNDMTHVSLDCYLDGKACSCHGNELEEFAPIWGRIVNGKFPGSTMKLKRRIHDAEYSMYPIVFITSDWWPKTEETKAHGYTTVHVVQKQDQNVSNCKTYENRFIDREVGVIILEKTIIHGEGNDEPSYNYWFYEKDERPFLPKEILDEEFSEINNGGYFLSIKRYEEMPKYIPGCMPTVDFNEYENKYVESKGYLAGDKIKNLVTACTFSDTPTISLKLIEWQSDWNFVISDYYGHKMFKVSSEDAIAFVEKIKENKE